MISRRLRPVIVDCLFVQAGFAESVSHDLTSGGRGQDLEDTAPGSTGSQVDTVFTTTIRVQRPFPRTMAVPLVIGTMMELTGPAIPNSTLHLQPATH